MPDVRVSTREPGWRIRAFPCDLDIRTIWLVAAIAATSAIVTAIGLVASRSGLTPFWGRFMEIAEGFVLLTLVPLGWPSSTCTPPPGR